MNVHESLEHAWLKGTSTEGGRKAIAQDHLKALQAKLRKRLNWEVGISAVRVCTFKT